MNAVAIRFAYPAHEHDAILQKRIRPFVEDILRYRANASVIVRKTWTNDSELMVVAEDVRPDDVATRAQAIVEGDDASGGSARPHLVEIGVYQPSDFFGSTALGVLRDRFHRDMLGYVFAANQARRRSRGAGMTIAINLLADVCAADGREYPFWPLSTYIHAELFLRRNPGSRPAFETAYQRIRDQAGAPSTPSVLSRFRSSPGIGSAIGVLTADVSRVIATEPLSEDEWSVGPSSTAGGVHGFFGIAGTDSAALFRHPRHRCYRAVVNIMFGLLPAIGFSAGERCLACYVLWRAFADATSEPETHLRDVVEQMAEEVMSTTVIAK